MNVEIISRATVAWALAALLIATGTYYALLFTLAQYLQNGLGKSALVSGLTLVPWVAAFGVAGQLVRRLPERRLRFAPAAGCLFLAAGYAAIGAVLFTGAHPEGLLVCLLAAGGLGLGINFSAIGVAGFGTLYLGLPHAGATAATTAFATVAAALAAAALLAAFAAWRATRPASVANLAVEAGLDATN